jgi:hypothetical protein
VTICEKKKKTSKEFHTGRRFYSPDDGVLTSEGGFCEEELAHNLIEKVTENAVGIHINVKDMGISLKEFRK